MHYSWSWYRLLRRLTRSEPPVIAYILGGVDSGKTTLAQFLMERLAQKSRTAYIDCDPGQSTVGPPTCLGLEFAGASAQNAGAPLLRFVGSTSPVGHLLPTLTGIVRLAQKAMSLGARYVILDSSGFCLGDVAREFQIRVIELLQPSHIVALEREKELTSLLAPFSGHPRMRIHRLRVSRHVVPRDFSMRRAYREERFQRYFARGRRRHLDYRRLAVYGHVPHPGQERYRLLALCDADQFVVALGTCLWWQREKQQMEIFAPPFEFSRVVSVCFGSVYVDASGRQLSTTEALATRGAPAGSGKVAAEPGGMHRNEPQEGG